MRLIAAILLGSVALYGQFGNATRIQARPVAATAPTDTYVICWDASATTWKPCAPGGAGTSIAGDVTGNLAASTVVKFQGRAFASIAPTDTFVICWDAGGSTWKPCAAPHKAMLLFNGAGLALSTGDLALYPGNGPETGTISRVDTSGAGAAGVACSATVDVWKRNAAIPSSANKISASAPATLSSSNLAQSMDISTWTKPVAANDVWSATLASVSGCLTVMVEIYFQ